MSRWTCSSQITVEYNLSYQAPVVQSADNFFPVGKSLADVSILCTEFSICSRNCEYAHSKHTHIKGMYKNLSQRLSWSIFFILWIAIYPLDYVICSFINWAQEANYIEQLPKKKKKSLIPFFRLNHLRRPQRTFDLSSYQLISMQTFHNSIEKGNKKISISLRRLTIN